MHGCHLLDQCAALRARPIRPMHIDATFAGRIFLSQGKLEGLSNDECVDRVRNQCIPAMTICFPFWCAVHTVTFAAFSPAYRMAWAQCAAVVWNALVSEQNQIARRRELENRTAASSS